MNKRLYRVVVNPCLGLLQVVSELTPRSGSSGRAGGQGRRLAPLRCISFAVWAALGWVSTVAFAGAQIVPDHAAPANQQPSVQAAANGVPVVEIQTPSPGGVSRNHYQQFDIDHHGAVNNGIKMTP